MIKNVICPDQSVKLVSIPVIWVIALTLVGYNFEEFIESFYLAQREITSPHPHGKAVKSIAGVDALAQVP